MINHSDMNLIDMELVLYVVIQGFSQDGNSKFTGALSYLCDVTGKSKNTVAAGLMIILVCEKSNLIYLPPFEGFLTDLFHKFILALLFLFHQLVL